MKKTFDLYRCSPVMWADMVYTDALLFRIEVAKDAMAYYKKEADKIEDKIKDKEYHEYLKKFKDSENAVEWNRTFLDETKIK